MIRTFFAVVDAAGEFKRRNRIDDGEYDSQREAEQFRASLPNLDDYTVQPFTEEFDEAEELNDEDSERFHGYRRSSYNDG